MFLYFLNCLNFMIIRGKNVPHQSRQLHWHCSEIHSCYITRTDEIWIKRLNQKNISRDTHNSFEYFREATFSQFFQFHELQVSVASQNARGRNVRQTGRTFLRRTLSTKAKGGKTQERVSSLQLFRAGWTALFLFSSAFFRSGLFPPLLLRQSHASILAS